MTADASTDIILDARNLTRYFGGGYRFPFGEMPLIRAVDGVSLSVRRGETFAIVGESGCGKSTLARLILRLIEPTGGSVRFEGREITGTPPEAMRRLRRDMQIIFQDPFGSLNPRMTVGALIGEPLSVHGIASGRERDARVREMLRLVGLRPDHAGRYPHEFSGGQRQRIGIARALATRPRLLIGDEPVSALDVSIRAQVINLLEDLKAQLGLTLILVAHDLAVIRHTSDRIAVMYLGEIVEIADRDSLFETPRHPYTRSLIDAIPVPVPGARAARTLLQGDPPSPAAPPPGCRFHTRCVYAKDICRTDRPALRDIASGHRVACHLAGELQAHTLPAALETVSAARQRRVALFAGAQGIPASNA
ncbi:MULTISPECIES: oligopeptide/dipeptide ABC transporter ATP-binding protein [Rhodomicrobium]|uniref:ABC transporter ATP-binding protein n=1 Tax=Rhodomicrobium TaxID=1068 RepID=UPI000B4B93DE|nr:MULTISPECIES: oligopeptide/dipeptide ABC transporter ATP-binding protein [Rhodomicrobium]